MQWFPLSPGDLVLRILALLSAAAAFTCPPQSDYAGRREIVLTQAKSLLSGSFEAGSHYAGGVFLRDTNTFIAMALENQNISHVEDLLALLLTRQLADGDIGCAGLKLNKDGSVQGIIPKAGVDTDAESSYIQAVAKLVEHTADDTLLDRPVESVVDGKTLPVWKRMHNALSYIRSPSGRFSAKHGLVWSGTTVDWGDVQNTDGEPGVQGCCDMDNKTSTVTVTVYANAMFVLAARDLANLIESRDSQAAAQWRSDAAQVRENVLHQMWMPDGGANNTGKWLPHLYMIGPVCGNAHSSSNYPPQPGPGYQCFLPRPSPFLHIQGFDETAMYYHGSTIVSIQAGFLTTAQVLDSLRKMRHNVLDAGGNVTTGLNNWPPYPCEAFPGVKPMLCHAASPRGPVGYQNGCDWAWFGGRLVQGLLENGLVDDALTELRPMIDRVCAHQGFFEYYLPSGEPAGSPTFHGAAGVLGKAIEMLNSVLSH